MSKVNEIDQMNDLERWFSCLNLFDFSFFFLSHPSEKKRRQKEACNCGWNEKSTSKKANNSHIYCKVYTQCNKMLIWIVVNVIFYNLFVTPNKNNFYKKYSNNVI